MFMILVILNFPPESYQGSLTYSKCSKISNTFLFLLEFLFVSMLYIPVTNF